MRFPFSRKQPKSVAVPFRGCWWVAQPWLLAGGFPGDADPAVAAAKLDTLLAAGMRHIVCLQQAHETSRGEACIAYASALTRLAAQQQLTVTWQHFPIRDMDITDAPTMNRILDDIDAAITSGQPTYVHCYGGHGRTGTVIGCWLVRHGLTGPDALRRLKKLRQHDDYLRAWASPQTEPQYQMVLDWAPLDTHRDTER